MAVTADNADAAEVHLNSVPTERIRLLTAELRGTSSAAPDEIDVLVMQVLLNEYSNAVAHLRAVARIAAATVDGVVAPMVETERAVHRYVKTIDAQTANWVAKSGARK